MWPVSADDDARNNDVMQMLVLMSAGPIDPDLVYLAAAFGGAVSSDNSLLLAGLWKAYGEVKVREPCLLHMPICTAVQPPFSMMLHSILAIRVQVEACCRGV